MSDFTNDPGKVITILSDLESCLQTETFDIASLFDCM